MASLLILAIATAMAALRADYRGKQPWMKYDASGNALETEDVPSFELITRVDRQNEGFDSIL